MDGARKLFATLANYGVEPRLGNASGTWEFDIEGAGVWTVTVDRGALRVAGGQPSLPGEAGTQPKTRLRMREGELLRLARGDGHENLFMGLLRGAIVIEGQLAFAQRLQAIFPLPEGWDAVP
jgi:hypothetical protein